MRSLPRLPVTSERLETLVEMMMDQERGYCILCLNPCIFRVHEKGVYLYCSKCKMQVNIRSEEGAERYGSFLKGVLTGVIRGHEEDTDRGLGKGDFGLGERLEGPGEDGEEGEGGEE